MIEGAGISGIFGQLINEASPIGSPIFFGLIVLIIFVWLYWGLGISFVSGLMIGFLLLGFLHLSFGGIFTYLFLGAGAVIGILAAASVYQRLARYG